MALATTVPFRLFKVLLGNGATPEVFTAPCGLTANAIAFSKDTNSTVVPDCTNPDAPAWVERDVVSNSAAISGSGVMATESLPTWWAAYDSGVSIHTRVQVDLAAPSGGYWEGSFHVTRFEPGGTRGNRVTVTIAMESDGDVNWTPAT
jgi:predicted secreted protein